MPWIIVRYSSYTRQTIVRLPIHILYFAFAQVGCYPDTLPSAPDRAFIGRPRPAPPLHPRDRAPVAGATHAAVALAAACSSPAAAAVPMLLLPAAATTAAGQQRGFPMEHGPALTLDLLLARPAAAGCLAPPAASALRPPRLPSRTPAGSAAGLPRPTASPAAGLPASPRLHPGGPAPFAAPVGASGSRCFLRLLGRPRRLRRLLGRMPARLPGCSRPSAALGLLLLAVPASRSAPSRSAPPHARPGSASGLQRRLPASPCSARAARAARWPAPRASWPTPARPAPQRRLRLAVSSALARLRPRALASPAPGPAFALPAAGLPRRVRPPRSQAAGFRLLPGLPASARSPACRLLHLHPPYRREKRQGPAGRKEKILLENKAKGRVLEKKN
nr:translation initiation factor IF-2-like [Aegilops tauschii subsp. strangulata]